jgi:two-component system, OmpR family, phosphate regulon sensor histidine kinase PhoR
MGSWRIYCFKDTDIQTQTSLIDALPDPVILLDDDRKIVAANPAGRRLLGGQVIGQDLLRVLRHPEALSAVNAVLADDVVARSTTISLPAPMRRDFEVHVSALRDSEVAAVLVLRDITSLRGAEQMRADFVANVSHELRSPLSSLVGFIETLQGAARHDEKARDRFLSIMDQEAQRMTRLIDDLLSLSGVEANEHILPNEAIDLTALLERVASTLSGRAQDKGMRIEFSPAEDLPGITGDTDQLTEVFHNLVENAIKYGRAGTPVRLSVDRTERVPDIGGLGVAVSVRDESDGIAPEHLPRLTERFYRADKGRSRGMGGTGLGLAIVKHIVNRHRGRLIIDSTRGVGSEF